MRRRMLMTAGMWVMVAVSLGAADDLLFTDDFASLKPGWGKPSEIKQVADKRMTITLPAENIFSTLYTGAAFGDVDVRAEVVQDKGEADQPAGLIFWAEDNENFYVARLAAEGRITVGRKSRGKWLSPVNDGAAHPEVRAGRGQRNEIRVVTSGRTARVFVNGKPSAAFQGYPPQKESHIGLFVESGAEPSVVGFAALSVRRGPPSPPAAPTAAGVLFADDFTTMDPAWGGGDDVQRVANRHLLIDLGPELRRRTLYQGGLFDDADLSVKITELRGDPDQPAGLIFWGDDTKTHVACTLSLGGKVTIQRFRKDQKPVVNTLDASQQIRKGLGQANELRLILKGKNAQVFVNGKSLATYTGFPPDKGSRIGLIAESGKTPATWAFSELVVRKAE